LCLRFLLKKTYSFSQTLFLDFSITLGGRWGGEGNVEIGKRKEKGKGRDRKRRSGLSPSKKTS